jgi:predicted negative regulator of RcsB-dependent stress response
MGLPIEDRDHNLKRTKHLAIGVVLLGVGVLIGFSLRERTDRDEEQNAAVAATKATASRIAPERAPFDAPREIAPEIKVPKAAESPALGQKWRVWLEAALGGKPSGELIKLGKLPEAEIQKFLAANSSDPDAWIAAAYLREGKPSFREAALRFPGDPAIQARMAISTDDPAERRSAIEKLRAVDPDNAMGDYLSALDHLKQGRQSEALKDLAASLNKTDVDDFTAQLFPAFTEAHLSAGFEGVDAEVAALASIPREGLSQLLNLSKQLKNLQATSHAETATAIRSAGLTLGQNLQSGKHELVIDQLVGMSIEKQFLNPSSDTSRLNEIAIEQAEIQRLFKTVHPKLLQASPSIVAGYMERFKTLGERQAIQWLEMQTSQNEKP